LRLARRILEEIDESTSAATVSRGGLWISGDVEQALAHLRWIVGAENEAALTLDREDRLTLNASWLANASKGDETDLDESRVRLASYISANEGLLLLLEVTESSHRYRLHLGRRTPTAGGEIPVVSPLNLDHNFDSRINPYRRNGLKLATERPPLDFDSLIAINPAVRWLNLRTKLVVPPGNITFHELAEAYAKVELWLDYLARGSNRGAQEIGIEREERLLSQRPLSNGVSTTGMNRMLTGTGEASMSRVEHGPH